MNITQHTLIALFILFSVNVSVAKPTTNLEDNPTLIFTMWDIITDKSYIIDLEINVQEFKTRPVNFNFNIIDIIAAKVGDKIESVINFRWSVVGGYSSKYEIGYVGSYPDDVTPTDADILLISQRLKRLNYYFKGHVYTEKPNKVGVKEGGQPSHYLDLWEGNFDGLSSDKLEGRGGRNGMILWSQFAVDRNKIIKQPLGNIYLGSNGKLEFLLDNE